jgi:thiol-disulfide isomerase/thioredoxin
MIADDVHQPPLYYKYKAKFTPEEWQAIVKKAKDRHEKETAQSTRFNRLIGKPAPPLPVGEWLNSKPLTWADLRGKIVVLKFWAIGCAPCYNEISVLKGTDKKDEESQEPNKKGSKIPIVYIGVHAPGNSSEEIQKVVNKHKLRAPICIDRIGSDKSAPGEFFGRCAVNSMPTSVAVDEKGRILAHGSLSEVLTTVSQRRNKLVEGK